MSTVAALLIAAGAYAAGLLTPALVRLVKKLGGGSEG